MNTELSEWIAVEHCWTRVLKGTDPECVPNRIAFIEKSPRVRIRGRMLCMETNPDGLHGCSPPAGDAWLYGAPEGDEKEWCDAMLRLLGYTFAEEN